eukprot:CAMPEP_0196758688 /NCGR_PEP_ID=MMETSP1091-20130531/104318_1 /TAXON_ID=302021 /ORGANISM="Rhodomonas sp., Strain CCMP768" /LENGTH=107 /DNA_ID=CAMNT_0042107519 /DNA_START=25 /DNA_END=348 /DNA_ORIENTATION=-
MSQLCNAVLPPSEKGATATTRTLAPPPGCPGSPTLRCRSAILQRLTRRPRHWAGHPGRIAVELGARRDSQVWAAVCRSVGPSLMSLARAMTGSAAPSQLVSLHSSHE